MIRDEHRNACIEAMAMAIFVADGRCAFEWEDVWGPARQDYIERATAAFDALHGLAFVIPIEATEEMLMAGFEVIMEPPMDSDKFGEWFATMAATGDLTNQPGKKL